MAVLAVELPGVGVSPDDVASRSGRRPTSDFALSRYTTMAGLHVAVRRHQPSFLSPYPGFGRAVCRGISMSHGLGITAASTT